MVERRRDGFYAVVVSRKLSVGSARRNLIVCMGLPSGRLDGSSAHTVLNNNLPNWITYRSSPPPANMTAPSRDTGDSSPLAPPVEGSNETQHASLAEALERSSVLLAALNLSDSPSESRPSGTSPTINAAVLQRHRRPDETEEAKEDSDLQQEVASTDATTTDTSTTLSAAVPNDNTGQPPSPNSQSNNDDVTTGPFYVDLIDEDDQQRRRPMRRRPRRRRGERASSDVAQESSDTAVDGVSTTDISNAELLVPTVSERHVSAFYQSIMAQVYLLEEQEGSRGGHNSNDAPNRRMNTRGARGA